MADEDYDFVVIGAGAGGLTAARFAARLGAKVALVERDRIGGDCTWTGCVPSKALIRVAKAAHEIRAGQRFGIWTGAVDVRMNDVRRYIAGRVQQVYESAPPEILDREGIDVILGQAEFENGHTLNAGGRRLHGQRFLITTGASPVIPAIAGLESVPYVTYHRIFDNDRLPESLIVVGGGPLGMEIAQAYRRLGSRVTVVATRVLPRDDPDAADTVRRVCEREGIRFVFARATAVRHDGREVCVTSEHEETSGDCLLLAAGRKPNLTGLALERAGVIHSERGIPVDDRLRTNVRHVYAAGDVLGGEQFSHVSAWQAFEATRNALLPGTASGRPNPIAWTTFTDPEVAQVGLTESQARSRFRGRLTIVRWNLSRVDRAVCDDEKDGFIKIITTGDGTVTGATIVASRAGEMSAELSVAIARRLKIGDIATAIHAYPTYATAMQQMASEIALTNWVTSVQGRIVRRLLGFAPRTQTRERVHAEDRH
jgi:pyruvate/2-oxoglutarate dehydrogenase complex dihydrolipoamide dehydrogenase (E3) component